MKAIRICRICRICRIWPDTASSALDSGQFRLSKNASAVVADVHHRFLTAVHRLLTAAHRLRTAKCSADELTDYRTGTSGGGRWATTSSSTFETLPTFLKAEFLAWPQVPVITPVLGGTRSIDIPFAANRPATSLMSFRAALSTVPTIDFLRLSTTAPLRGCKLPKPLYSRPESPPSWLAGPSVRRSATVIAGSGPSRSRRPSKSMRIPRELGPEGGPGRTGRLAP